MQYIFKLEEEIIPSEFIQLENLLVPLYSFSYHFTKSYQQKHVLYFSSKPKWRGFIYDNHELVGSLSIVERKLDNPFTLVIAGIGNLGIKESHQSKGLALLLLEHANTFTKEKGFNISLLFCTPRLSKLYIKAGYTKIKQPVVYEENGKIEEEPTAFAYPISVEQDKYVQIISDGLNVGKGSL